MSYTNSSEMENYGLPVANKEQCEQNVQYLKNALPYSEHHNLHLYVDPGGNVSRDCLGNLKPDINKIMDSFKK